MSDMLAFKGDTITYTGASPPENISPYTPYFVISCVYRQIHGGLVSVIKNDLGEVSFILLNQDWKIERGINYAR